MSQPSTDPSTEVSTEVGAVPTTASPPDGKQRGSMRSPEALARTARLGEQPWQTSEPSTGLFKGTVRSLREIAAQRELLGLLVRR